MRSFARANPCLRAQPNGQSSPFLSFINSATAYANLTDLLGASSASFLANVASALDTSAGTLVPSSDPTVVAGYKAIYNTTVALMGTPVGQVELLLSLTGSAGGTNKVIAIQAALQHPLSQGRIWVTSDSAFDPPQIDPNYGSHSAGTCPSHNPLQSAP